MPEDYGAGAGSRPRLGADPHEDETSRLFVCGRCHVQVLVCLRCDRGQIYCAGSCAESARREAQRDAGRRYQKSKRGRRMHADRQRRYRARLNRVTHHGSPAERPAALLASVPPACAAKASSPSKVEPSSLRRPLEGGRDRLTCHWCARPLSPFVRQGFLRRRRALRISTA